MLHLKSGPLAGCLAGALLFAPAAAQADPLALRLPSAGGVVAIGWGEVSGGYRAEPHLGFSVDATLPDTVGISTASVSGWAVRANRGLWLGIGKENRQR